MLATLLQFLGGPIVQKILDFIPDPAERQRQQFALMQAAQEAATKAEADQRDIDKTEAASASVFVAGWRPSVGWLCVVTLAWQWLFAPMLTWGANWAATAFGWTIPQLPTLNSGDTQTLLYALLGIGGLRTVDKITGNDTVAIGVGKLGQAIRGAVGGK
jgi:hypothetical protein